MKIYLVVNISKMMKTDRRTEKYSTLSSKDKESRRV